MRANAPMASHHIWRGWRADAALAAWALIALLVAPGCDETKAPGAGAADVPEYTRFAYSPNGEDGTVSRYAFDDDTGQLRLIGATETGGGASEIALHPNGRYLYVTSSNGILQYMVESNGDLTELGGPQPATGQWPRSITIAPSGRFAYVANSPDDTVSQYRVGDDGRLTALTPASVPAGAGARQVVVEAASEYAYVVNLNQANVSQTVSTTTGRSSHSTRPRSPPGALRSRSPWRRPEISPTS